MRSRFPFLVLPLALWACAESKQAWKDITTGTKHAFRSIGKSCPDAAPGRAVGATDADGALGCFQKAVGSEDAELLLRIVCHGRSPASCKHDATAQKEADAGVKQFAKRSWTDVLGSWTEPGDKVTVYAIDNEPKPNMVSTVTVCRIAEPPTRDGADAGAPAGLGWAVCDVDEMPREAAQKKSGS